MQAGLKGVAIMEQKSETPNVILSYKGGEVNQPKPFDLSGIADRKKDAIKIGEKLKKIGEEGRANRMLACNSEITLYRCEHCGKVRIINAHLCRDRLCPTCQYLLSVKRYNEMRRTIATIKISNYEWRFVTLTIRNCAPDDLGKTIDRMLKAWDKMIRRRTVRPALAGWARSVEITYNACTGYMHPHIHILMACQKGQVPGILDIRRWWQEALDLSYSPICDIEEPYSDNGKECIQAAIIEAFKYAVKSKQVKDMPLSSFAALTWAMKGKKLVSYGGIIRKARANLGIKENEDIEQEVEGDICECGMQMAEMMARWSFSEEAYSIIIEKAGMKNGKKCKKSEDKGFI